MECIANVLDKTLLNVGQGIITFNTTVGRLTATAAYGDYCNVTCYGIGTVLVGLANQRLRNDMVGQTCAHKVLCTYSSVVLLNVFGIGR